MNLDGADRRTFLKSAVTAAGCTLLPFVSIEAADEQMGRTGRRIGFVDLDLENYHANVFLKALRGPLVERGFVVAGATAMKGQEGRAWADKNHVTYFEDVQALNKAVDFFMVLAPSNPEVHLDLCRAVLPSGKPVYVDKTFAPSAAVAEEIFALADKHKTPIQTASSLRYTNVQDDVRKNAPLKPRHVITWGSGGSFDEYAIHPLELLISIMGPTATAMMRRGTAESSQLLVEFSDGRTGVVNVFPQTDTPFAASITTEKATRYVPVDASKIFINNLSAILDFFAAGKPNVDREETMAIMRLLDAARDPRALQGFIRL